MAILRARSCFALWEKLFQNFYKVLSQKRQPKVADLHRALSFRIYLTTVCPRDQLGPYFDANSPYDYKLAPEEELADPTKLAVLEGKVGGSG